MNFIASVIIFIIMVIIYLHLIQQYKKGEDLEIYEMDYVNNKQLQEICDIKQPILFKFDKIEPSFFEDIQTTRLNASYELKVKDIRDYFRESREHAGDHIKMSLFAFDKLMKSDVKHIYFTENNEEYVEDSGLTPVYAKLSPYLKPQYSIILHTKYDIMTGTNQSYTPLRYHQNYRQYFAVTSGKISVKLTPWKSYKFLHPTKNYDNYEFCSDIDVWSPPSKYSGEMQKLKFLEFDVHPGYILYIPSYWWYTIKYIEENTIVASITYNSAMNIISNSPDLVKYYIQQMQTSHSSSVTPTQMEKSASTEKEKETPVDSATNEEPTTPTSIPTPPPPSQI